MEEVVEVVGMSESLPNTSAKSAKELKEASRI